MTKESDRILSLELNFKNFMNNVEEKFDAIMEKLDTIPWTYATKQELNAVKDEICNNRTTKNIFIQTRWSLIVAIISAGAFIITALLNK